MGLDALISLCPLGQLLRNVCIEYRIKPVSSPIVSDYYSVLLFTICMQENHENDHSTNVRA